MKIYILAVYLLISLSACATYYTKPGATNIDFQRDQNDCLVKAGQAGYYGGDFSANLARDRFIAQCLGGQGWTQTNQ